MESGCYTPILIGELSFPPRRRQRAIRRTLDGLRSTGSSFILYVHPVCLTLVLLYPTLVLLCPTFVPHARHSYLLCPMLVPHMGLRMVWHSVPGVCHHPLHTLSAERVTMRNLMRRRSLRFMHPSAHSLRGARNHV